MFSDRADMVDTWDQRRHSLRMSLALSGDEEKARTAGCNDFVPKPYSPRQLLAKIRQYFGLIQPIHLYRIS